MEIGGYEKGVSITNNEYIEQWEDKGQSNYL